MNTNKEGKIMKITEMPGYQNLARELELHDIVINDKYFALGHKMIPVLGSYVNEYEGYMRVYVLLAVGEKAVIWDGFNIFDDLAEMQNLWWSTWTAKYAEDVKKCFTLRANGIGVTFDPIDPWYPVLRDTEKVIGSNVQMNIFEYINALFAKADDLFNSIQVEGE